VNASLVELRHTLHQHAEPSGEESETSSLVAEALSALEPDDVITELGGEGVAAIFEGKAPGPTVMLRADLDALPIPDGDLPYASKHAGTAHKCGHDGHMTIQVGVAERLAKARPDAGRVVILFQPSEETGEGAVRVIEDPGFAPLRPDVAVATHNLPGYEKGAIIVRDGTFAAASSGIRVSLRGLTSHAGEPQNGRSPAPAVAALIQSWASVPQRRTGFNTQAQVTVVHARLGEMAFGTSPGEAVVAATVRARTDEVLESLLDRCERLATGIAETFELEVETERVEPFPATENEPEVVALIAETATELGLPVVHRKATFPWSEDFGHFTRAFGGALFGLGAGEDTPALHHPNYDFPDDILEPGIELFTALVPKLIALRSETPRGG